MKFSNDSFLNRLSLWKKGGVKMCEACQTRPYKLLCDSLSHTNDLFRLCVECATRYQHNGLYPLEFFNLAAKYGTENNLEADFYDTETGKAMQPEYDVIVPSGFEFPVFEVVKSNMDRVIDFAVIRYHITDDIIGALISFDKASILQSIDSRISKTRAVCYQMLGIAADVLGDYAAEWVKKQWSNRLNNESLLNYPKSLAKCLPAGEGFFLWKQACDQLNDERELTQTLWGLQYFNSNQSLDWFESNCHRITDISLNWGYAAALCKLDQERMHSWLSFGRPLSLMALTALTVYAQKNDPNRVQIPKINHNVDLLFSLNDSEMREVLNNYAVKDNSPRVRNDIDYICRHWHSKNQPLLQLTFNTAVIVYKCQHAFWQL